MAMAQTGGTPQKPSKRTEMNRNCVVSLGAFAVCRWPLAVTVVFWLLPIALFCCLIEALLAEENSRPLMANAILLPALVRQVLRGVFFGLRVEGVVPTTYLHFLADSWRVVHLGLGSQLLVDASISQEVSYSRTRNES